MFFNKKPRGSSDGKKSPKYTYSSNSYIHTCTYTALPPKEPLKNQIHCKLFLSINNNIWEHACLLHLCCFSSQCKKQKRPRSRITFRRVITSQWALHSLTSVAYLHYKSDVGYIEHKNTLGKGERGHKIIIFKSAGHIEDLSRPTAR